MAENSTYRILKGEWSVNGGLRTLPKDSRVVVGAIDPNGRVWLGYWNKSIASIDGSAVRIYAAKDGLDVGNVTSILPEATQVWAARHER